MFEREAKELQTWLTSKMVLVESEDFGQDLEDVEVLSPAWCPVWRSRHGAVGDTSDDSLMNEPFVRVGSSVTMGLWAESKGSVVVARLSR